MIPGDVGSTMTVGSDREISRVVIAPQRNGAGAITDLQRTGIADADTRGTDADQVDRIAEGETGHGASEMRDVVELERGRGALKGDHRPGGDRRGKFQQTSAVDRKRAQTCDTCSNVKASGLNLHDPGVGDTQHA